MEQHTKTKKISFAFILLLMRRAAAFVLAAVLALALCGCEGAVLRLYNAASALLSGVTTAGSDNTSSNAPAQTADGSFTLHFIDVGQALSVLIECDGQYMLYDGGNVEDGSLVVSYLKSHNVQQLAAVFCSHAHEDHVGGLAGVLAVFPSAAVYSPVTQAESTCFNNFVKYANQQGRQLEVPAAGTTWQLGGATLHLLGPLRQYEDTNNTSLVLRIDYGQTSFLLTGDMEAEAERDLVDSGADLSADVLQVGHHGSSTSTSYVFLNAVMPQIGIISCGSNNDYGHPHDEVLSRLRDAGVDTYRTDLSGTILVTSDGANYSVGYERFADDDQQNPTETQSPGSAVQTIGYIGNVKSKKFHRPTCANLPAEHNQILFSTYDEAVAAGYTPCGGCKPE